MFGEDISDYVFIATEEGEKLKNYPLGNRANHNPQLVSLCHRLQNKSGDLPGTHCLRDLLNRTMKEVVGNRGFNDIDEAMLKKMFKDNGYVLRPRQQAAASHPEVEPPPKNVQDRITRRHSDGKVIVVNFGS